MDASPPPGQNSSSTPALGRGRELPRTTLDRHAASQDLGTLGFSGLTGLCRARTGRFRPDRRGALEARDGFPIVYSEARALRLAVPDEVCVVCDDQTCPAVDVRELPDGDCAWLTPNLYPIVYPSEPDDGASDALGVHLVHWSTRRHDGGWAHAGRATSVALLAQLARAEEFLLHGADERFPESGEGHRGHVSVVKNHGRRVGGSVAHDHQQILLSAREPSEPRRTIGLAERLLRETPAALHVDEVDGRAVLLVPPFMRRPLHAFVVPKRADRAPAGWLHHLDEATLEALAVALQRTFLAADACMTARLGEPAWNLVCHAGQGCDPLFELRPFSQPMGGFEHLGLYLCEERPETSAARLREALAATR
ncbi:MAG: hypothetical protein H6825_16035 [Planctomycetes bacterium]|nr:hypothetical protein [Planctomycetota bacterium]